MKLFAILITILALLTASAKSAGTHDMMILDVKVPASLTPNATSAVAYFTIMSHGTVEDALMSVSTPVASNATLHESYRDGDIAKMRELVSIDVTPGRLVKLEQGGMHVMLTGLKSPLKKGDEIVLSLTFAKAGEIQVKATVGEAVAGHVHTD
jgi:periplasmic copper chaperone A